MKMSLYQNGTLVESSLSSTGRYSFDTDLGIYTVALDATGLPFDFTCPSSGDTTVTMSIQDSVKYDLNFGLRCKAGFDINASSIFGDRFRPAWEETIIIRAGDAANTYGVYCANGVSGTVNISITGPAKYVSAAPGALSPGNSNNHSITWNVDDFGNVDGTKDFNIIIKVDTTAQADEQICFTVSVTPTAGDNNPSNNTLTQCFTVRTSYDPNDKSVYPSGNIDTTHDWLTYTIRFQNTGNDTAIHIQIIDTLDNDIDMASFKLLAYSHPNITQILEGGIAKFNFPNIMLTDSNVNEPLSHGYIQYKVKLKDNLPIGTQVKNTAYIYFDFNAPVVTNTTLNTITTATAVSPLSFGAGPEVRIYPNPARDKAQIIIEGVKEQLRLNLYNPIGELVQSLKINSHHELDLSSLPNGVYHVSITMPDGLISSKRLIVGR